MGRNCNSNWHCRHQPWAHGGGAGKYCHYDQGCVYCNAGTVPKGSGCSGVEDAPYSDRCDTNIEGCNYCQAGKYSGEGYLPA